MDSGRSGRKASFYKPELDAIRFCAFLMVFVHHIIPENPKGSGHLSAFASLIGRSMGFGLSLFFILSAYLLSRLLIQEKRDFGRINIRAFYIRRCLRIWPLYYFYIGASLILTIVFIPASPLIGIASYAVMLGNFLIWFTAAAGEYVLPIGHLWSISVEEQFYLIIPACILLLSIGQLRIAAWFLIILSLGTAAYLNYAGLPRELVWRHSLVQGVMFGTGILLAIHVPDKGLAIGTWKGRVACLAGAIVLVIASEAFTHVQNSLLPPSALSSAAGFACLAIAGALLIGACVQDSVSVPAWIRYCGKISYGLYVFHAPALELASSLLPKGGSWTLLKDILAFGLTFCFAALSFALLEQPFLRLKRSFEAIKTGPSPASEP